MRLQDKYCKQKFEQGRKEIFCMYVCTYILWSTILQCMYNITTVIIRTFLLAALRKFTRGGREMAIRGGRG